MQKQREYFANKKHNKRIEDIKSTVALFFLLYVSSLIIIDFVL